MNHKLDKLQVCEHLANLTWERNECLICGLESPLEYTHILIDGKGCTLLLHGYNAVLIELMLIHFGVRLEVGERGRGKGRGREDREIEREGEGNREIEREGEGGSREGED